MVQTNRTYRRLGLWRPQVVALVRAVLLLAVNPNRICADTGPGQA